MYCLIQYIDIPKNESETAIQSLLSMESLKTLQSTSLTATETKKLMVNPNCPVQILLDYVCSEIGIDKNCMLFYTTNFDFCDFETGEMLGIKLLKPWSYPTNVLKSKQTYIIVFYEKDEFGQYSRLEPLVNRQSKQYSETVLRIKRQISSTIRRMSSMRKPKSRRGSTSSKGSVPDSFSSIKPGHQKKRTSSSGTRSKKSVSSKN